MRIDPRIALLTMIVAIVAAGAAFLRPASTPGPHSMDRLLRRNAGEAKATHRLRAVLISVQVALSLVLLVAAGLLGRTVLNLRRIEIGFQPDHLMTFAVQPHLHGYESRALDQLARRLERRLQEEGGLRRAGFVSPTPLRSSYVTTSLYRSDDPDVRPLIGAGFFVTPGFLPAIGARPLAGDSAWQADSGTVVITRNTVDSLWGPATSPSDVIGRMIPTRPNRGRLVRVAAVIEDLRLSDITREPVPLVFSPLMQRWAGLSLTGFVDVTGQRQPANIVRRIITADSPELPLFDLRSARAAIDLQFADRHAMAQAAATLGSIGLVLAVVGLYAVVSAVVNSRRREIGIRGALGAAPQRILRRVLVGGLVPVVVGLPFGVAGALVIGKLLGPQLFGLESLDPLAYVSAMVLLVAAALGATLLPAWRATRISPAEVLRDE
jgi:hypothetical protein